MCHRAHITCTRAVSSGMLPCTVTACSAGCLGLDKHQQLCTAPLFHVLIWPTGSLLVSFKSRLSVPPYRIENMSSDVGIRFAQRGVPQPSSKWNELVPLPGGNKMAYAWDEPILDHYMTIQVCTSLLTCLSLRRHCCMHCPWLSCHDRMAYQYCLNMPEAAALD